MLAKGRPDQQDRHDQEDAVSTKGRNKSVLHMLNLPPELVGTRPGIHQRHPAPQSAAHVPRQTVQPLAVQILRVQSTVGVAHEPSDADGLAEKVSESVANAVVALGKVRVGRVVLRRPNEGASNLDDDHNAIQCALPKTEPRCRQCQGLLQRKGVAHRELNHIPDRHKHLPAPLGIGDGNQQIRPGKCLWVLRLRQGDRVWVSPVLLTSVHGSLGDLNVA
mmetsp:Transcript_20795/g.45713  ORF Transcript_20795/g.45713 Transcript_20795/m.45713 type:complete len:220 (+) Transcript_20795:322-981(+)